MTPNSSSKLSLYLHNKFGPIVHVSSNYFTIDKFCFWLTQRISRNSFPLQISSLNFVTFPWTCTLIVGTYYLNPILYWMWYLHLLRWYTLQCFDGVSTSKWLDEEMVVNISCNVVLYLIDIFKVHKIWEGRKILRNHYLTFDYSTYCQKKVKISQNFVAFSDYMNFTGRSCWNSQHYGETIHPTETNVFFPPVDLHWFF